MAKILTSTIVAFPAVEGRPAYKERYFLLENSIMDEDLTFVTIDFKGDELYQILPRQEAWDEYNRTVDAALAA